MPEAIQRFTSFVDGQFDPADELAPTLPVYEPATGIEYATLQCATEDRVTAAVAAAQSAFNTWSKQPGAIRAAALHRMADLIEARQDAFAATECRDTGKPLWLARAVDIPRAVANLRFFAAAASQFASESHFDPSAEGAPAINYTLRQALGPVACISPWNLPLYLLTWKVAPALAAGNCVVAKPSEVTPATATLLAQVAKDAELPSGVLNILQGDGEATGAVLVNDPGIRAISFTGSTRVGRWIARQAAPRFVKTSLEMGGKNPALVFADCDLEAAVDSVVRSAFTNQGQICLCTSRILVQESIYEAFRDALVARATALKVGDPMQPDSQQGALVSREHQAKVLDAIEQARQQGARILCGGAATSPGGRCRDGWFVQPTVLDGLDNRCETNQMEIFGPVATVQAFTDAEEAIALANDSRYGLAASVWTGAIDTAHRVGAALECGIVWVNCWMRRDLRTPFGGGKQSGLGREGGWEAMRFFTEPKNICVQYHE